MKKIAKILLYLLCIITLYVGTSEGLRYLVVDDTASYTRLTLHEMYTTESNIDVLFVGASLVYRSLIPEIADTYFNAYTFNLGSSNQQMDASLVLIKEALSYHQIEQIYLEVSYDIALLENNIERTQMTGTYIISDYMRPSFRKIAYLLKASSFDHYANSFILARRNWKDIFDYNQIKKIVKKKSEPSYKNYQWVRQQDDDEYYAGRGYVANESMMSNDNLWNSAGYYPINMQKISYDWIYYLQKIIRLCKKHNIQLTLFSSPRPEITLVGKGNYDEYRIFIQSIAKEAQINFYDFNLCKPKYFNTAEMTYFKDESHLNSLGAQKFTQVFSLFFSGKIKPEELFYHSYCEKIESKEAFVYGIAGPQYNADKDINSMKIVSNRPEELEYRIIITEENGSQRMIQDFSMNYVFSVPSEQHGILTIVWRPKKQVDNVTVIEAEL